MGSSNSKFLFKALLTVTGIAGTSALLGLPALALTNSQSDLAHHPITESNLILAQDSGSGNSGNSPGGSGTGAGGSTTGEDGTSAGNGSDGNAGSSSEAGEGGGLGGSGNGVGETGDAYENIGGQQEEGPNGAESLIEGNNGIDGDSGVNNNSNSIEDSTSGSGEGGGQGGTNFGSPINPANPDAEGGEAFEQAPDTQPLPDAQEDSTDGMNNRSMMQQGGQSGSSSDSGFGGGQGGVQGGTQGGPNYNNQINPANPDPVGGQGLENAPNNERLPGASQQSPSGGSYYNNTPGTSGGSGAGTGAGGNAAGVRALW